MCGIAAVFSLEPSDRIGTWLERSLRRVVHRGPDGSGLVTGDGHQVLTGSDSGPARWGLGHVRLAILDLSVAGRQPMSSPDGFCWITYNGEVYNYLELRSELEGLGHEFRTSTDTEVVLASYQQWGRDCVQRFNGMFAFVVVDLQRNRAFAARDRLGVKPIFIWCRDSQTVIVSEPKQLLDFPGFRPRANRQQITDFLVDGVLGHDPDQCCFEGVHPLPPAHTLCWPLDIMPKQASSRIYWQPRLASDTSGWENAVEKTGFLLRDAVRIRLRSDVPVGSCLSGGLDSSSIVGMVSNGLGKAIKTFSSCFDDPRFDESYYIDAVNRRWGLQGIKVFPPPGGLLEDLDKVIYHQDEPFTTSSIYAQWCVMRTARNHNVPVLLDGQGGDEALCGYRKYTAFYLMDLLRRHRYQEALLHLIRFIVRGDRGLFNIRLAGRYLPNWVRKEHDSLGDMLRPPWRSLARHVWADRMKDTKSVHDHQWADLRHWSLPSLLRYEDRNSMAHSIETRLPFLDYRFIENCLSLQESLFFRGGRTKRLLVEAMKDALPREVRQRRTKMGFETPSQVWMKGHVGRSLEKRVRSCERLSRILDTRMCGDAFESYRNGNSQWSDRTLFRIASLAVWLECFDVEV